MPPAACFSGPREYLDRVKARLTGKPLADIVCVEIFAGSGGFTAAIRKAGLPRSSGVDHKPSTNSKCPMCVLDLVTPAGQEILWKILESPDLRACHLAPACGTSSKARNIPAGPYAPQPLRNSEFPDGFPFLSGQDAARVHAANVLYGLTGSIILHCFHRGILVSVENPANSWFWLVSGMAKTNHLPLLSTNLHHCMFGASRKKHTKLLRTMPQMTLLGVLCDGKHEHEPWGKLASGAWATASECAYPPKMCASMAHAFVTQLLSLGAIPSATSLALDHLALPRAAQVASGKQPKGKRVKPLVPAFASYVTLRGPAESLPPAGKLSASFAMPPDVQASPALVSLPTGARCLRHSKVPGVSQNGEGHSALTEMEFGLPWNPKDFVSKALGEKHPKNIIDGVPLALKEAIKTMVEGGPTSSAVERTAALRKWMLRAKELRCEKTGDFHMPVHCQEILKGKSMRLFDEMLQASDYPDLDLARQVCKGFDLLGPIPDSGVMPKKLTTAALSEEDIRCVADLNRESIWASTKNCRDLDIAKEVYRSTMQELDKGWLVGPFELGDLPPGSLLTRRFGVSQTASDAVMGQVTKVRPTSRNLLRIS